MNFRVRAWLCAVVVLACSSVATVPAAAGTGTGDGVGTVLTVAQLGPLAAPAQSLAAGAVISAPEPAQRADHDRHDADQLPQQSNASDRIAKPIVIVAGVMFFGLTVLLLTARIIVRRRTRRAADQR